MEQPLPTPTQPAQRPIRSFVLRQGRMSPAQTRAVETLGPKFVLPYIPHTRLEGKEIFGRDAPLIVEVGFGMGEATAAIARTHADKNFIGIEVHTPGVGALLKLIGENSIENLRIIQHDAVDVLTNTVADGSLSGLHIFFPDPWPKKRHHKRRLIQPAFVDLLCRKLAPGAFLHLATDWEDYANHMRDVLQREPALGNAPDAINGFASHSHYRVSSSFERKGFAKGHGIWDLLFLRK